MGAIAVDLDSHSSAYTNSFPHFEENRIVHAAYGCRVATDVGVHGFRSVLSLGVGHTEVARAIVALLADRRLQRYVVVDAAPTMLAVFREHLSPFPDGLELVEDRFETFRSEQPFDLIEAGFVLEHVEDPAMLLRRLHGLLGPGGRLYVAVPNARSLHRVLGHLAGMLPDVFQLSEADRMVGHLRYFDVNSLSTLVGECGWRIERVEGMLLKPFTTAQMQALNLSTEIWQALQAAAVPYPEISNAFCMELTAAT